MAGFGGAEPPDARLVLGVTGRSGEHAVVADPLSGAVHRRRLSGGTLCHGPLLALGGRVLFGGHRGRLPVLRSLPLTLRGPARSLGRADTFTASATPGRVWVGDWGRPVRRWSNRSLPVELRELDPRGRVTARMRTRLPRFSSLHAATTQGFVGSEGRWLTLRRGARELVRVRDGWLVAAGRSRVAWCRGDCRRLIVRGPEGTRALAPPAGARLRGWGGALSPDDRLLAAPVEVGGRARAAVADLRSGRWTLVPDGGLRGAEGLAWSASGGRLYFTSGDRRLRAWEVGAGRSEALPIRPGGRILSIAAAR
jgi:hypothetical protein